MTQLPLFTECEWCRLRAAECVAAFSGGEMTLCGHCVESMGKAYRIKVKRASLSTPPENANAPRRGDRSARITATQSDQVSGAGVPASRACGACAESISEKEAR
jgi:hypothetical protein